MARPKASPKYRHFTPRDYAVVRIDGDDHYLGKYGSPESWEKYHRLLAEKHKPVAAADPRAPEAVPTVAEVVLAFWKHAGSHYRTSDGTPTEELGNIKAAVRPLVELYGLTPAREFGPLALRAVRERMVAAGLTRTGLNDRIGRIRRVFRWAASVEMVPVAVVSALATVAGLQKGRTQAKEADPVEPVPLEVVEATLPFLTRPVAALVRLQLLTGMRPGEACSMRGVDLKPGEPDWIYRPSSHKTAHRGKARAIPLGPKARELIEGFLREDPSAYLFSPADAVAALHQGRPRKSKPTPSEKSKRSPSPGSKHSRRYGRSSYRNAIATACDRAFPHPKLSTIKPGKLTEDQRAELKAWRKAHRWHPHQLRHAAATAIRARFGLEAAQVVLGHSRADVTQVYAERDLSKAAEVMREVG